VDEIDWRSEAEGSSIASVLMTSLLRVSVVLGRLEHACIVCYIYYLLLHNCGGGPDRAMVRNKTVTQTRVRDKNINILYTDT
jgi:hypothetical protein